MLYRLKASTQESAGRPHNMSALGRRMLLMTEKYARHYSPQLMIMSFRMCSASTAAIHGIATRKRVVYTVSQHIGKSQGV